MPHRFFSAPAEVFMAAFSALLATVGGIDNLSSPAIWDKTQFRLVCILGALAGAFLAIALFPPREQVGNYARRIALKFASSGISGLIFTPVIIRWQGWPIDVDVVLAVSAIVALLSVSVISALVPYFTKRVIGQATGAEPQEPKS